MTPQRLNNYLKAQRRKSGLSQSEMAYLVGCQSGSQVSRYEKRRRLPPLNVALAYEAVFGVPVAQLFAGLNQSEVVRVKTRFSALDGRLNQQQEKSARGHKLHWLGEHHETKIHHQ